MCVCACVTCVCVCMCDVCVCVCVCVFRQCLSLETYLIFLCTSGNQGLHKWLVFSVSPVSLLPDPQNVASTSEYNPQQPETCIYTGGRERGYEIANDVFLKCGATHIKLHTLLQLLPDVKFMWYQSLGDILCSVSNHSEGIKLTIPLFSDHSLVLLSQILHACT